MIGNILLLILGFILLIKGADIFVDGASSTAENFKVPKVLIGLTIIAFGTSAPEFAVSMSAFKSGSADMVLGNVIGSCIMNILLILGVSSMICPIKVKDNTVKKEIPLAILISLLLVTLFIDIPLSNGKINQITRSDGIVIILFFSVFLYYLISIAKKKKQEEPTEPKFNIWLSLLFIAIGLVCIIFGSDFVVDNATAIAKKIGLSERLISLTIVAFGTSLPELVTSIISAKKGEHDLLVGNIIGSNIFNICVVLGIPVIIYGALIPSTFQLVDLITVVIAPIILFIFSKTYNEIKRFEGFVMLFMFFIYYLIVFII